MRTGALKQLREACLQQTGGDVQKGNKLLVTKFQEMVDQKLVDPKKVSYRALFEGLVNLDGVELNDPKQVVEAVSSSAFTNITTLITHAIVIEPYEVRMADIGQLVTEGEAAMTDEENVRGMTAIGGVRRRLETQAYEETDFEEKRVSVRKSDFGRIISLTFEDIFNDRTGDIQDRANTIGEDGSQHREQMVIETLECLPRTSFGEAASSAFVYKGTAYTSAQFYAATHATLPIDGQVNNNVVTSGGIDETSFSTAYLRFSSMRDEKGKIIRVRPEVVVVHDQQELKLATLLATDKAVGGNNNDVNQFGPRGKVKLATITTPFLSSSGQLAYMGTPRRSLLWLWVEKPQTVTMGATTDAAFRRRIVWEARFNYYGGIAHRDYRYIVKIST